MAETDADALDPEIIDPIGRLLAASRSALLITGAGLSADSGLPTYRGVGGLYEQELVEEKIPIEEALSGDMMRRNPALCWKYIHQIEAACRGASFNRAHAVIADLERHMDRVWVLTQNVDGFHHAAGSRNVIPIHGDVHELICTQCEWRDRVQDYAGLAIPPSCADCGAVVRPAVVLFGELLPQAALRDLARELEAGFDVVFSIGTSSLFPYIAQPFVVAALQGVPTVEINPAATDVSRFAAHVVRARAKVAMHAIWQAYRALADPA